MKTERYFNVSVGTFSTKWAPDSYLCDDYKFNVTCGINEKRGLYFLRYAIEVEGEPKDIDKFIEYLRSVGFKIK